MSYSILRVEGIKTLGDLRGLGKHNVDRVSETNLDIDKEKSAENIQLIECDSYLKRFNEITAEMRAEHNARMETIRADRQKTFEQAINSAHNDVACEFLCTSDEEFFQGRSRAEIETWARQSLEFIEQEVGISKDKIIHASVHMDEKTPHLHVVAVPLLRAWDGRRKEETLQISRKKFIRTKEDMSLVQDKYHEKMKSCGYDMQRGESKNVRHEKIVEFKEKTNYHQEVAQQSKEEASKVKQEVKSLHTKQTGLEISILNREYELKELNKKAEEAKSLDKIEVKEKGGLLRSKTVELSVEDFENIRTLAQASEGLRRENKALEKKNIQLSDKVDTLTDEKAMLQKEDDRLRRENDRLRKERDEYKGKFMVLEKLVDKIQEVYREKLPKHFKALEQAIGYAKHQVNKTIDVFKSNNIEKKFKKVDLSPNEKSGYELAEKDQRTQQKDRGIER